MVEVVIMAGRGGLVSPSTSPPLTSHTHSFSPPHPELKCPPVEIMSGDIPEDPDEGKTCKGAG
ncbi:hypothetical protein E2C01_011505 [Portunus trituberculatus]|uniref:Uncharacterized protein n=1 Tax=Portunus trituberculatus TaxID=210409 RepID=A0A5B7DB79_PORTR|nr:hypothetical protein [Portunus trituberculatus]